MAIKPSDEIKTAATLTKQPLANQYGDPGLSSLAERVAVLEATVSAVLAHLDKGV